jgi:CheY-like chemotaxis protein
MAEQEALIRAKKILAVDDEEDILETIEDVLSDSQVDTARDYDAASRKIREKTYDLVVLDIMGVNGLKLLEETVAKGIPTVMLTAHAINPETLMESIRKGAIAYLPKEKLAELDELLERLFGAYQKGEPPWKLVFDEIGSYFDERFGPGWKQKDQGFWRDFERTYQVGRGIQERLQHNRQIIDKGV